MSLKMNKPLVSVDWLCTNLGNEKLVILDCTIRKVTSMDLIADEKTQIKDALFFDIENTFSDTQSAFPNTILSPEEFEEKAQELGICQDAIVICYDDLGTYTSPRVWWMFQLMGFKNIAVLDGGFPAWKAAGFLVETSKKRQLKRGNFKTIYQLEKLRDTQDIVKALENTDVLIIDARSEGRFNGIAPEPRKGLKSGHMPNAVSLPFGEIQQNGKMKSTAELVHIFNNFRKHKEIIFTCGSGITAAILNLGATMAEVKHTSVYDGSWTEWASTKGTSIVP
jgi:thiosulfate/3-mercaptopyruvate sulfurtransferase